MGKIFRTFNYYGAWNSGIRVIWLLTVFKMVPTYEMLMNVYVASWIFTGGLLLLIYLKHMRKLEKKAIK